MTLVTGNDSQCYSNSYKLLLILIILLLLLCLNLGLHLFTLQNTKKLEAASGVSFFLLKFLIFDSILYAQLLLCREIMTILNLE